MYNGYANEDSYYFDVVWANSQPLYEAIKAHARAMRPHHEVMTDQTLGRNMKDAIQAMVSNGGWGWPSCPDEFVAVKAESTRLLHGINLNNINEEEFGANIRQALEIDSEREAPETKPDKEAAYCPACNRLISLNRDGTFRRHKGGDEFDRATDGICSQSHSLPPE